jgi:hypothetical protein
VAKAAAEGDLRSDIDPAVPRGCCSAWSTRIEWYRPGGTAAADDLAATVVAVAFDGLRVRPS